MPENTVTVVPQNQLAVLTAPEAVTVAPPNIAALVGEYGREILPISVFKVTDASTFVEANQYWTKSKDFVARITSAFADSKALAHKAHKAITTLEKQLIDPAQRVADHMRDEIIRYQKEQDRIRIEAEQAEFRRRQAAAEAERQQQIALALEQQRLEAERRKSEEELQAPWLTEPVKAPEPVEMAIPLPPPVVVEPVRFLSTVPQVIGGGTLRNKPWEAEVIDFDKFFEAAYHDRNLRQYFVVDQPALNRKARELGKDLEKSFPGVRGKQDQTLAR